MWTPCDAVDYDENGNEIHRCPFQNDPNDYVSCRDYCGSGVDEDSYPYEEETWGYEERNYQLLYSD